MTIALDEELIAFFAGDPVGPHLRLPRVADDPTHPMYTAVQHALELLEPHAVETALPGGQFKGLNGRLDREALLYEARIGVLAQCIATEISRLRCLKLRGQDSQDRPPPYDHPALQDLTPDASFLVPLTEFDVDGSRLVRNGFAFTVVPPVQQVNAAYWLIQCLAASKRQPHACVRLDPFLVGPADTYPSMVYKMLWYGTRLDWKRLASLKEEEHGRWLPDPSGLALPSVRYTDYVWSPRDHEVHFRCEELPSCEVLTVRGSRYFHAIYDPARERFCHVDGAVRLYLPEEWAARESSHLRKAGKLGKRVKIFQIDEPVTRELLCSLCPAFFVWNDDVDRYFGGPQN